MAIVSATADVYLAVSLKIENVVCLMSYMAVAAWHLPKHGSHGGRVSGIRFNSLKSSRDSSRPYSLKTMHPCQLFLGRVSLATGARDSATKKQHRFKGFRPQLHCKSSKSQKTFCNVQEGLAALKPAVVLSVMC